jgi:uncharacterized protein
VSDRHPDGTGRLLAVVLVVAAGWNVVGNLVLPGSLYVPANLAVAAALVALAHRAGLGTAELGLERRRVPAGLAAGLAAATVVAVALAVASTVPAVEEAFEAAELDADGTFDRWFVPLVRIPLGTAVFEEVLFRSVILGALLRRHCPRTAVVVSSALFGLWHVVPASESAGADLAGIAEVLGTVAATAVAGVAFALLRLRSGSVVAPVLAHAAVNSGAYVAALAARGAIG